MTPPLEQPGDLQLAVLRVLWERGELTVTDVQAALETEHRDLAQTTVATVLTRMERRGMVSHRTQGRQFIYTAEITEDDLRSSTLDHVMDRMFGGDVAELVNHLLSSKDIAPGDLARVKTLIESRQRKGGPRHDR